MLSTIPYMRHTFKIAAVGGVLALAVVAWLAQSTSSKSLPSSSSPSGQVPSSRIPIPNIILKDNPHELRTLSLTRRSDRKQFTVYRASAETGPSFLTGPWLASWNANQSNPVLWPASQTAVESALSTLSMVSGTPGTDSSSQSLGLISISGAASSPRSVTLFPPDVGGIISAQIDSQAYRLTSDPSSILDDATWNVLTNPLLAPGFGREIHIISVQEADRELLIERRFRAWVVRAGKINGPYTTTYVGDTASCESLAKVLSELAFNSISFSSPADSTTSGPSAQITIYRRASGTLISESSENPSSSDRATFHTANITLRGTLGVSGTALEGTSRLALQSANGAARLFGPVSGQLDPSILMQVSMNHWRFVSRQALDTPAADVLRFTIGQNEYLRKFTKWQSTTPNRSITSLPDRSSEVPLDTTVRNFLFSLEYARADSVSVAPSQRPTDAVIVQLYSPLLKEPKQLQLWAQAGQVTIVDGDRCLVYTTPSDVLALSALLPR